MNAFSKSYQSVIDWSKDMKEARLSRIRSEARTAALESQDPAERQRAKGTIGGLGKTEVNTRLLRNSFA